MEENKVHTFENVIDAARYVMAQDELLWQNRTKAPVVGNPQTSKPIPIDSMDYPFTGYINTASDDNKFIMSRLMSGRFSLKPNLMRKGCIFRGEHTYHTHCCANLHREDKTSYIGDLIFGQEMYCLMLSHPLVKLLDLGIQLNGRHVRFEMNLYGLTQHYYNRTNLLDLTSDINVAMFFATQKYNSKDDTYEPVTDETKEGVLYFYELRGMVDFNFPGSCLSTIGLQVFPRSGRQKGFLYAMDKGENFNNLEQVHVVHFKHNAKIARQINEETQGGKLYFPDDILARHWRNRTHTDVVSRSAVKMNVHLNPGETQNTVTNKLREVGIGVRNYVPRFSRDELHEYYEAVAHEGLWEQFCEQIHIPGDNDGRMMSELLNTPNNPDYAWAFKEGVDKKLNYAEGYLLNTYAHCLLR